ncbi:MAG: hypothetical protein KatS3mg045_0088 [Bellilinea sp.]|nr:MAG: hypothetical protein KatS3mg045_0088 [Bellilinea sp.]
MSPVNLSKGAISGIYIAPECNEECLFLVMMTLQTGYNRFTVAFQRQFLGCACAILKKRCDVLRKDRIVQIWLQTSV